MLLQKFSPTVLVYKYPNTCDYHLSINWFICCKLRQTKLTKFVNLKLASVKLGFRNEARGNSTDDR